MDNTIAIKVQNLTKIYHLYKKPQDRLKEALNPFKKSYHHDFYAMDDVSFEIRKGVTVGIIGNNGAGKSTLLKMITGVLNPTSGSIETHGKIASLLELGAGFNPEMSGYENIYLYGTLMGFSQTDMDGKVADILDFADIGEFINQPVKMYSSGMFARLAFSVAINIEPDIFIVDEILSVGDMVFQAKSMAKMTSMMNEGTTVIFVSHNTHLIKTLCDEAILIDAGKVLEIGDTAKVTGKYIELQHLNMNSEMSNISDHMENTDQENTLSNNSIPTCVNLEEQDLASTISQRYGDGRATILDVQILDNNFKPLDELISKNVYYVQISVKFNEDLPTFVVGFSLSSLDGVQQLTWTNAQDNIEFGPVKEGTIKIITTKVIVPIKADIYNLSVGVEYPVIFNQQHQFLDVIMNVKPIKVNFMSSTKGFSSMFYSPANYTVNDV